MVALLGILGVAGLCASAVLALVALFKGTPWKTVGWTAGISAVLIGTALVLTGSGTSQPAGSPGSGGAPATGGQQPAEPTKTAEPPKKDLEVTETHTESDGFVQYVAGTVKNNTSRTYGYVQVEINLYDESGAQVGSTLDNTNNLEPGGTWKFRAPVFENGVKSYKIKNVTGF